MEGNIKKCTQCCQEKSIGEFGKNGQKLRSQCKICVNSNRKDRYNKNKLSDQMSSLSIRETHEDFVRIKEYHFIPPTYNENYEKFESLPDDHYINYLLKTGHLKKVKYIPN